MRGCYAVENTIRSPPFPVRRTVGRNDQMKGPGPILRGWVGAVANTRYFTYLAH
jgi:hypothetical protein